jgi:hypothetical protein
MATLIDKITFISDPITLSNGKSKHTINVDAKVFDCWDLKGKQLNDDIEYTIKSKVKPEYNDTITIVMPRAFSPTKNQKALNAQTALICATKLVVSGQSGGKKTTVVAEVFFHWLESKSNS